MVYRATYLQDGGLDAGNVQAGTVPFTPGDPADSRGAGMGSGQQAHPDIQRAAFEDNQPTAGRIEVSGDYGRGSNLGESRYQRGKFKDYLFNAGQMWRDAELPGQFTYTPEEVDIQQLQMAEAMDFDPYRQEALGSLAQASTSGLQSALSQQAAAGGLTAADRMALASSFNRQRMGGQADVLGRFGVAEAEDLYRTEQANRDLQNKAYLQNVEARNMAQLQNIGQLSGMTSEQFQQALERMREEERMKFAEAQQQNVWET